MFDRADIGDNTQFQHGSGSQSTTNKGEKDTTSSKDTTSNTDKDWSLRLPLRESFTYAEGKDKDGEYEETTLPYDSRTTNASTRNKLQMLQEEEAMQEEQARREEAQQRLQQGQRPEQRLQQEQRLKQGQIPGERLQQGQRSGERLQQGQRPGERLQQGQRPGERLQQGQRPEERLHLNDDEHEKEMFVQELFNNKTFMTSLGNVLKGDTNNKTNSLMEDYTNMQREPQVMVEELPTMATLLPTKIYKLPTFQGEANWFEWVQKVKALAGKMGAKDYLINAPSSLIHGAEGITSTYWQNANNTQRKVMSCLFYEVYSSIGTEYKHYVQNIQDNDIIALWTNLHNGFQTPGMLTLITMFGKYMNTTMTRGGSVTKYISNLNRYYNMLVAVGGDLNEQVRIAKFLTGLPQEYEMQKQLILYQEKNWTYVEVQNKILQYYQQSPTGNERKEKAYYTQSKLKKKSWKRFANKRTPHAKKEEAHLSEKQKQEGCFNCGKKGHWAAECRSKSKNNFQNNFQKKGKFERKEKTTTKDNEQAETWICQTREKQPGSRKEKETAFYTEQRNRGVNEWVLDSGCTRHMTNNIDHFIPETLEEVHNVEILTGKGLLYPSHKGQVKLANNIILDDVLLCKTLPRSLISGSKLDKANCTTVYKNRQATVYSRGRVALRIPLDEESGLYKRHIAGQEKVLKDRTPYMLTAQSTTKKNVSMEFLKIPLNPKEFKGEKHCKTKKESAYLIEDQLKTRPGKQHKNWRKIDLMSDSSRHQAGQRKQAKISETKQLKQDGSESQEKQISQDNIKDLNSTEAQANSPAKPHSKEKSCKSKKFRKAEEFMQDNQVANYSQKDPIRQTSSPNLEKNYKSGEENSQQNYADSHTSQRSNRQTNGQKFEKNCKNREKKLQQNYTGRHASQNSHKQPDRPNAEKNYKNGEQKNLEKLHRQTHQPNLSQTDRQPKIQKNANKRQFCELEKDWSEQTTNKQQLEPKFSVEKNYQKLSEKSCAKTMTKEHQNIKVLKTDFSEKNGFYEPNPSRQITEGKSHQKWTEKPSKFKKFKEDIYAEEDREIIYTEEDREILRLINESFELPDICEHTWQALINEYQIPNKEIKQEMAFLAQARHKRRSKADMEETESEDEDEEEHQHYESETDSAPDEEIEEYENLDELNMKDLHDMCNQNVNHYTFESTPTQKLQQKKLYLMHCRLGHRNFTEVKKLTNMKGQPTPCDTCLITKSTQENRNRLPSKRADKPNIRVHFDTQSLNHKTHQGFKVSLLSIDCNTGFMIGSCCKAKSDVSEASINVIRHMEVYQGSKVRIIRLDGGSEFFKLRKWAEKNGISVETSAPHCQYQNGYVERHTRTILDTFRASLFHSGLPKAFWGEAFLHAIYVHNVSIRNKDGRTPAESYLTHSAHNTLSSMKDIKTFGCLAYGHIYDKQRSNKKFSNRAFRGIYLGISYKDYRCHKIYDPQAKKCKAVRDMRAVETMFPWKKKVILSEPESFIKYEEDDGYKQFLQKKENIHGTPQEEEDQEAEDLSVNEDESQDLFANDGLQKPPMDTVLQLDLSRINEMDDSYDPSISWEEEDDEIIDDQEIYDRQPADWNNDSLLQEDLDSINNAYRDEYYEEMFLGEECRDTKRLITKEYNYISTILNKEDFDKYRHKSNAKNRKYLRTIRKHTCKSNRNLTKKEECYTAISTNESEPKNLKEARASPEWPQWDKAMADEMTSLVSKGTWEIIKKEDLPEGRKPLRNMWIYKKKKNKEGQVVRFKCRLVIKGYSQVEGIDYFETFASVAKFNTIRLIIALSAEFKWNLTQMDVKTAFLNGDLEEEIYMLPPEGYTTDVLLKLKKGLYGLKQAPRQWSKKLVTFLKSLGFVQCESDECLFILREGSSVLYMAVYVDDLIMSDNDSKLRDKVAAALKKEYEMDDMGTLEWFLGIRVEYTKEGIWLKQDAYIDTVAKRFNLQDAKAEELPANPGQKLSAQQCPVEIKDKVEMKDIPYTSAVGSVLYAAGGTMIQIAAPTGQVCRYMHNPGRAHWTAVKRIIKYLKTNKQRGLFYKYGTSKDPTLVGYCDSDYNANTDDRTSTTGYVFKLNGRTITWNSKKQSSTALSTSEAEYMALCEAAKEAVWLKRMLKEMGFPQGAVTIYEDNEGAIAFTKNNVNHKRNKHIDVRYHYTRRLVEDQELAIKYLPTTHMIADLLTKCPSKKQFTNLVDALCGTSFIENEVAKA